MLLSFLAHQLECEEFALAVLVKIYTTEDHEAVRALICCNHAVFPTADGHLAEYSQRLPLVKVEVKDADVIESDVSCAFIHSVVPATIYDEKVLSIAVFTPEG